MRLMLWLYNALLVLALIAIGVGVGALVGWAAALIVVGLLVLVLTVWVVERFMVRRGG